MTDMILFDLDGTLLPMDQDNFTQGYFKRLVAKISPLGYEPESLIKGVWAGTAAMIKNNGSCSNEQVFWKCFSQVCGERVFADKPIFDEFYSLEFQDVKNDCGFSKNSADIIAFLKLKGFRIALATNPIFPKIATESRIRWAGLNPSDFEIYTTYENSTYCKPNPLYYNEIIKKLDVNPQNCLMVGNDVDEDMISKSLGMKVFLLTDCLINKSKTDISSFPNGGFSELKTFISQL